MTIPFWVLLVHYVADFHLQTAWMAENKWQGGWALWTHVAVYALCWFWLGAPFVLITFVTHGLTDFVTSKITHALAERKAWHWFFCVVGADQLLHYGTLAWTLHLPREVSLLRTIGTPLRIPTWLLCDVFGYVDFAARQRISVLIAEGWLELRPGGVIGTIRTIFN